MCIRDRSIGVPKLSDYTGVSDLSHHFYTYSLLPLPEEFPEANFLAILIILDNQNTFKESSKILIPIMLSNNHWGNWSQTFHISRSSNKIAVNPQTIRTKKKTPINKIPFNTLNQAGTTGFEEVRDNWEIYQLMLTNGVLASKIKNFPTQDWQNGLRVE